jgi:hypothetical protein
VYARSTTVLARPGAIDAGIAYIREEVMPRLLGMSGCIGLSMLVDRSSGRCIVTSAWQTEDTMHASAEELRPLRDRAAETLGGGPLVEEWEIAVLHRDHASTPAACVRATWVRISAEHADRIVDIYRTTLLPQIREFEGFCSASFMVNRFTGYAVSSVTFDSYDAMRRTRNLAAVVREQDARSSSAEVVEVGEYELALAHLRVPELGCDHP